MTWIHPLFLLGLTAVAVPLFLHLFARRPAKTITLPTVEFLKMAIESQRKQNRLRELLLLLLRLAFVCLVTLTVSRPLLSSQKGSTGLPQNWTLMMDNTVSVSALQNGESMFTIAKRKAGSFIESRNPQDKIRLIPVLGEKVGVGFTNEKDRLLKELDEFPISYQAIQWSQKIGEILGKKENQHLVIFTDGRREGWQQPMSSNFQSQKITIVDVSDKKRFRNESIQSFDSTLLTKIKSNRSEAHLTTLHLDRWEKSEWKEIARQFTDVSKEGRGEIQLPSVESDSPTAVRVRLEEDDFPPDNVGYSFLAPPHFERVLVVNGNPSVTPREDAAHFVHTALLARQKEEAFEVSSVHLEQFRTIPNETNVIVLADCGLASEEQISILLPFVEKGGGLIVGGGESFQREGKRLPIERLLPASLRNIYSFPAPSRILKSDPEALQKGKILKALLLDPLPKHVVQLELENHVPLLVQKKVGKGTILFWTTTFHRAWNDLPLNSGYPAWIRTLISEVSPFEKMEKFKTFDVSKEVGLSEFTSEIGTIKKIEGFDLAPQGDKNSPTGWTLPNIPGLWKLPFVSGQDQKELYAETRADPREFDLEPATQEEVEKALAPIQVSWETANEKRGSFDTVTKEVSDRFALAAILVLLLETLLSGKLPRFIRKKSLVTSALLCLFPFSGFTLGEQSKIEIASIQSGNKAPYPRMLEYLLRYVPSVTHVDTASKTRSLKLSDPHLFDYPFLYWSGEGFFEISSAEKSRLKNYLQRGGFLFFDNAAGGKGGFETSVQKLLHELFPAQKLSPLPPDHPLYRSYFLLTRLQGRETTSEVLSLDLEGRSAAIYFSGDLAGAFALRTTGEFVSSLTGGEIQRTQALRSGVNLVMYALTLTYKQDQIHLPFILQRRK